jgi:farnesyl diphosphate synthase
MQDIVIARTVMNTEDPPANFIKYCQTIREKVNKNLERHFPPTIKKHDKLYQCMRYSTLNGGKRLRSVIIFATGEALGANSKALLLSSTAIELIHAFSLIQDDLPSFDNSDLRRGKPACHKVFGEATAILTCDALLAYAYQLLSGLSEYGVSEKNNLKIIGLLSQYIGFKGVTQGESLDIAMKDQPITLHKLIHIYRLKTSYLLCSCILFGALCANISDHKTLKELEKFGIYLGLAYQIQDDILGITMSTHILGKPQNADIINKKTTYPELVGLNKAKEYVAICIKQAVYHLEKSDIKNSMLHELCFHFFNRSY